MADLDDEPAEMSELDLSDDAAISGEDVVDTFGVAEGASEVSADPDEHSADEDEVADE